MSWTDYSSAPPAGNVVCALEAIDRVAALTIETERGRFPMILVRTGEGLRAYVNACPHQFLPLDYAGNQLLSADGTKLLCTVHGARFDAEDGRVVDGADCGLDAVPIQIEDGVVLIAQG